MSHIDEGRLHARLDGARSGATPDELAAIDAHLAGCAECSARLAEARRLIERTDVILAGAPPRPTGEPTPTLPLPAELSRRSRRESVRPVLVALWAASVVAAIGLGWLTRDLYRAEELAYESSAEAARAAPAAANAVANESSVPPPEGSGGLVAIPSGTPGAAVGGAEVASASRTSAAGGATAARAASVAPTGDVPPPAPIPEAVRGAAPPAQTAPAGGLVGPPALLDSTLAPAAPGITGAIPVPSAAAEPALVPDEIVVTAQAPGAEAPHASPVVASARAAPAAAPAAPAPPSPGVPLASFREAGAAIRWERVSPQEAERRLGTAPLVLPDLPLIDVEAAPVAGGAVVRVRHRTGAGVTLTLTQQLRSPPVAESDPGREQARAQRGEVHLLLEGPLPVEELRRLLDTAR